MPKIENARIAILATDGFEKSELFEPRRQLTEAGATVTIVSIKDGEIKSWDETDWGETVKVDAKIDQVNPSDFDALVLPGGQINPDVLRTDANAVDFVRAFYNTGKTLAAICHAPWLLIEADLVRGKTVTSWPSVRRDLANAGANVVDREVVVDGNIITSRNPDDIPAFASAVNEALQKAAEPADA